MVSASQVWMTSVRMSTSVLQPRSCVALASVSTLLVATSVTVPRVTLPVMMGDSARTTDEDCVTSDQCEVGARLPGVGVQSRWWTVAAPWGWPGVTSAPHVPGEAPVTITSCVMSRGWDLWVGILMSVPPCLTCVTMDSASTLLDHSAAAVTEASPQTCQGQVAWMSTNVQRSLALVNMSASTPLVPTNVAVHLATN